MSPTPETSDPDDLDPAAARELWCAVILQAFKDATSERAGIRAARDRRGAIAWLTKPNADFAEACALAGLDPDATRERAIEALSAERHTPVPPVAAQDVGAYPRAKRIEHDGLCLTVAQWAARVGLNRLTLSNRLREGWPIEEALKPTMRRGVKRTKQFDRAPAPGGGSNTLVVAY